MDAVRYDEARLLASLHEQLFPRHHIDLVHVENHSRVEWTSLCNHCEWALNILHGGTKIDEPFAVGAAGRVGHPGAVAAALTANGASLLPASARVSAPKAAAPARMREHVLIPPGRRAWRRRRGPRRSKAAPDQTS